MKERDSTSEWQQTGERVTSGSDNAIRIRERKAEIDILNSTTKVVRQQLKRGSARITPAGIRKFGEIVRENLIQPNSDVQRHIPRIFISRIRTESKIENEGETPALEHKVAAVARSKGGLSSFDRKWCPEKDEDGHSDHWRISVNLPR